MTATAGELERKMIPFETWKEKVPEKIYKIAMRDHKHGIPTGIAHDDELGWCIIQSGQGPYIAYSQTREEERDLLEKCLGLSCINRVDMLPLQLQTIYYNLLSEKQKVSTGHHIAFGWCVIRYFEQEHPCANTPYISFSESVLVMERLKKMNLSDCPTCKMDSYKTPGGCACKTCGMLGMQPWGG
jgi:hypothetical protein